MKKFRLMWDKDEEQAWLEEMCGQGWGFTRFFLGVYTFEPCEPGEYHYQVDLLDNWGGEREEYTRFMEESGVEVLCQWYRWVFLRKKAADGPFEMYSDQSSRIAHYEKIRTFFGVGAVLELICLFMTLPGAMTLGGAAWGSPALLVLLAGVLGQACYKTQQKIKKMRQG